MKLKKIVGAVIVPLALMTGVSASAKGKNSANVLLAYDATLSGTHLASGRYRLQWETHSPGATVTFQQGDKVAATVEGKVVERGTKYSMNEVIYDQKPDGSQTILEIRLKGSSKAIIFNE